MISDAKTIRTDPFNFLFDPTLMYSIQDLLCAKWLTIQRV